MSRKSRIYDVIVIGAGASGLTAAIFAAKQGCRTIVLDHSSTPAKKILSTGNGRCNFSNQKQGSFAYQCSDPAFVMKVMRQFGVRETLEYFEKTLQIHAVERDGYLYPRSMQATAVRNALLRNCSIYDVRLQQEIGIQKILPANGAFHIKTKTGDFFGKTCILATGGKAFPKSGSDGSGFVYARALGHTVEKPLPALVPLETDASWNKIAAGVRAHASVKLYIDGQEMASNTGEIQFTKYGVSGIPVFQVSRFASRALFTGKTPVVSIDLLPEMSEQTFLEREGDSLRKAELNPDEMKALLDGYLNHKLTETVLHLTRHHADPVRIAHILKHLTADVTGTKGFDQAQVTTGGIRLAEIHPETMESRLIPHLYVCGEMLDVDGICGGYNLQWAWSTGAISGQAAAAAACGRENQ